MSYKINEKIISKNIRETFPEEDKIIKKLISIFQTVLIKTNGKELEHPKNKVNIILGSNLELLINVYKTILDGYCRTPFIILRSAVESLIFGMYFTEFPSEETEYSLKGHKEFFNSKIRPGWLEYLLKKMDNDGVIFKNNKTQDYWYKLLGDSNLDELCNFSHMNIEYIFKTLDLGKYKLSLGPRLYKSEVLKAMLSKFIDTLVCTIVVTAVSLNIKINSKELNNLKKANTISSKLKK
jgi:hypothetical protein